MSLEKIRESVIEASLAEAKEINTSAEKQAAEKFASQQEHLRRELEHQFQTMSRQIEDEFARKLALFEGNAAKDILTAKNRAIRSIFDRARQVVLTSDPAAYAGTMKKFLTKISAERSGRVRAHREETNIFRKIVSEINRDRGEACWIELDEDNFLHDRGGFIFSSTDYEVDATLNTIFEDVEKSILPEIAKEFSGL